MKRTTQLIAAASLLLTACAGDRPDPGKGWDGEGGGGGQVATKPPPPPEPFIACPHHAKCAGGKF